MYDLQCAGCIFVASDSRQRKMKGDLNVFRRPNLKKRREIKITLSATLVASDNISVSHRIAAANFRTVNHQIQDRSNG